MGTPPAPALFIVSLRPGGSPARALGAAVLVSCPPVTVAPLAGAPSYSSSGHVRLRSNSNSCLSRVRTSLYPSCSRSVLRMALSLHDLEQHRQRAHPAAFLGAVGPAHVKVRTVHHVSLGEPWGFRRSRGLPVLFLAFGDDPQRGVGQRSLQRQGADSAQPQANGRFPPASSRSPA